MRIIQNETAAENGGNESYRFIRALTADTIDYVDIILPFFSDSSCSEDAIDERNYRVKLSDIRQDPDVIRRLPGFDERLGASFHVCPGEARAFWLGLMYRPLHIQQEELDQSPLKPSMVIETFDLLTAYWFAQTQFNAEQWRMIMDGMVLFFDADPIYANRLVPHTMPGFNSFAIIDGAIMYDIVRLVEFRPDRCYSLEEMIRSFVP